MTMGLENAEYVVEVLLGCNIVLMGWLHVRQRDLEKRLEERVEKGELEEIKVELHEIKQTLTEVRVENAKWQGLMQRALEQNSENS